MHDTSTGSNITAITVAGVNGSSSDLLAFGTTLVTDDLLTEGVEPSSKFVGRAKGIYSYADLKGSSLTLALSAVFENEKFNGSTLQFQGVDPFFSSPREVSVVGGTGKFRYARGYEAVYDARITGFNTIVAFNITLRLDWIGR